MANGVIQGAGLVFGSIGGILMITAVLLPNWRHNDPSNDPIESIQFHQGLWSRCVSLTTGHWQCDGYDNFILGLPDRIMIARSLSIGGVVFGFFAFALSFLAVKCINVMEDNPSAKQKIGLIAGSFWILAGIGIGGAASYYAFSVKRDFEICSMQDMGFDRSGTKCHVFGTCLFLAWAAMFVLIMSGGLMICGSCQVEEEEYNESRAYASYSRVKRNLSNTWQRVARNDSGRNVDKTYV